MPNVILRKVEKTYGKVTVLHEVSFDCKDRNFTSLLGPSGCGKSTTLRCIAGLEDIDNGEILFDSKLLSSHRLTTKPEERQLGVVFQSFALWPHLSVYQNVAYGLRRKGLSKENMQAKVAEVLDLVRMGGSENKRVTQLSGGQQQRIAIARAIAYDPEVLLLDEPMSSVDAKVKESMIVELTELQRKLGITMVYVTHDQAEAMAISDTIVVMNSGVVAQVGAPREIYERPTNEFVANFIGRANVFRGEITECNTIGMQCVDIGGSTIHFLADVRHEIGAKVLLSIKSEAIRLYHHDPVVDLNSWKGIVKRKMFFGEKYEYIVELNIGLIRATLAPDDEFVVGEEVYVYLDPKRLLAISNPMKTSKTLF